MNRMQKMIKVKNRDNLSLLLHLIMIIFKRLPQQIVIMLSLYRFKAQSESYCKINFNLGSVILLGSSNF